MEYTFGPLVLLSQDKSRMIDFLSDVFEFEVDDHDFSTLHKGAMVFKIESSSEVHPFTNDVKFVIKLKSFEQMKELISKYNFFLYRKSQAEERPKEQFNLLNSDDPSSFAIKDLDGRIWQFEMDFSRTNGATFS